MSTKNSNDNIGNRTRDLPACGTVQVCGYLGKAHCKYIQGRHETVLEKLDPQTAGTIEGWCQWISEDRSNQLRPGTGKSRNWAVGTTGTGTGKYSSTGSPGFVRLCTFFILTPSITSFPVSYLLATFLCSFLCGMRQCTCHCFTHQSALEELRERGDGVTWQICGDLLWPKYTLPSDSEFICTAHIVCCYGENGNWDTTSIDEPPKNLDLIMAYKLCKYVSYQDC